MPETARRTRNTRRRTKDRVLQARIPEQLDTELRGRAEQLGLSVSTIVRNVLLHTFDLVEGVVSDSAQLARAIDGRGAPPSPPPAASGDSANPAQDGAVIGWQEAILNRNGVCEQCNTILLKGERAAVGVPVGPRPVLLCPECLGALSSVDRPGPDPAEQEEKAAVPARAAGRGKQTHN